jgi:hypothetical protein
LCIFRQSLKDIKHIYDEYAYSHFALEIFKEICNSCWKERYGFLTIDTMKEPEEGRYRKNFEKCLTFNI